MRELWILDTIHTERDRDANDAATPPAGVSEAQARSRQVEVLWLGLVYSIAMRSVQHNTLLGHEDVSVRTSPSWRVSVSKVLPPPVDLQIALNRERGYATCVFECGAEHGQPSRRTLHVAFDPKDHRGHILLTNATRVSSDELATLLLEPFWSGRPGVDQSTSAGREVSPTPGTMASKDPLSEHVGDR